MLVSSPSPDRAVLVITRDLFFRAKLEAVVRGAGCEPVRRGVAGLAVVELENDDSLTRIRELAQSGTRVLAFGSHVRAELLRAGREAGAEAVPNSQVETTLRQLLSTVER